MRHSPLSFTAPDSDYEQQALAQGRKDGLANAKINLKGKSNNFRIWYMAGYKDVKKNT